MIQRLPHVSFRQRRDYSAAPRYHGPVHHQAALSRRYSLELTNMSVPDREHDTRLQVDGKAEHDLARVGRQTRASHDLRFDFASARDAESRRDLIET